MKKIITILFSLGSFATSFAQYNHPSNDDRNYHRWNDQYASSSNENRDFGRGDRNRDYFNRVTISSARERDFQVEKINRDFAFRVRAIQNDPYLRHREKKAAIRYASIERSRQIQMVNDRFNCNR